MRPTGMFGGKANGKKETSEDQTGISTMDTTCNFPIEGDKKVLERKRPGLKVHPFSICIVFVKHGLQRGEQLIILDIFSFWKGSLEDIAFQHLLNSPASEQKTNCSIYVRKCLKKSNMLHN